MGRMRGEEGGWVRGGQGGVGRKRGRGRVGGGKGEERKRRSWG